MGIKEFFTKLFGKKGGVYGDTIVINIPNELYYKELALYTVSSLIANAISRSDINCYIDGKMVRNEDFFKLNVSPNENETSSYFWHKVINNVIRKNKCLVVETNDGNLYVADNYVIEKSQPIKGDVYSGVVVGDFRFVRYFDQSNTYMFRLNNISGAELISGLNESYSKIINAAQKDFIRNHSFRYKLRVNSVKEGDESFNEYFENVVKSYMNKYLENDDAVIPIYEGYEFESDNKNSYAADDFIKLKKDLFETVFSTYHVPISLINGNITNMKEIVAALLSFGVDPFADMITESLNKGAGVENYVKGNYFKVNTSVINHRDIVENAANIANLISCGYSCIDEIRIANGDAPLNTKWSRAHFLTKNFDFIDSQCFNISNNKGGEDN